MNTTRAKHIGDTVELFPHHTKIPLMSCSDPAYMYADNLTEALLHPNPEAQLAHIGDTQLEYLG